MIKIPISLEDDEVRELARMAVDAGVSEEELLREAIQSLLFSRHSVAIPRFARRLGPLAPPPTDH